MSQGMSALLISGMLLLSVVALLATVVVFLMIRADRSSCPPLQIPDNLRIIFSIDTESFMTWFYPDYEPTGKPVPNFAEKTLQNFIEFLKKSKGII